MNPIEKSAVLLNLAAELRRQGSWTGETHIQKAMYLLQEILGLPTDFEFVLYKHGPFSFDLRELLNQMEAERAIELEEQEYPYGPKIKEGVLGPRILATVKGSNQFQGQISFIAKELGNARVADLERIATALYVTLDSRVPPTNRVPKVTELKPHIKPAEAEAAFARIQQLIKKALQMGLVPDPKLKSH